MGRGWTSLAWGSSTRGLLGTRRLLRSGGTPAAVMAKPGALGEEPAASWNRPLSRSGQIWIGAQATQQKWPKLDWSTGHSAEVATAGALEVDPKAGALEEDPTAGATGH